MENVKGFLKHHIEDDRYRNMDEHPIELKRVPRLRESLPAAGKQLYSNGLLKDWFDSAYRILLEKQKIEDTKNL